MMVVLILKQPKMNVHIDFPIASMTCINKGTTFNDYKLENSSIAWRKEMRR
jgi:hypothetical protein